MIMLRSLPIALLAAPGALASPQSPFQKVAEVTDTTADAAKVVPVDVNMDGIEDLIVGVETGPGVKVLLGRGDGTFEPSYRVGESVGAVAHFETVDWNSDGLVDVLLGTQDGNDWQVSVGLATSAGRDLEVQPLASGTAVIEGLAGADIEGDGDLDLVVHEWIPGGLQFSGRLSWFETTSGGSSAAPTVIYSFDEFQRFSVEDGDGDGIQDVIITSWAFGGPVFYRGLGQGAFSPMIDSVGGFIGHISLDTGDLNGDGLLDVVTVFLGRVEVFYATGSFSYSFPGTDLGPGPNGWHRDVYLVDLEFDGDLDLVATEEAPGTAGATLVYENVGGALQPPASAYDGTTLTRAFSDVDGDGRVDLLATGESSLEVRLQQPPGGLTRFGPALDASPPLVGTSLMGALDVDGDGLADAFGQNDGQVVWYRNRGDLSFSPESVLFPFESTVRLMYGVELSGDGLFDIVSIEEVGGLEAVRVRMNLSNGLFAAPVDLASSSSIARVFPVDVDGDGDNDLVTTPLSNAPVALGVLLNDGAGHFTAGASVGTLGAWVRNLLRADLDQDGRGDLVATSASSIQVARGLSSGGYGPFAAVHTGAVTNQLGIGDFDEDGRPDLYGYIGGEIQWLRQTAQSTFQAPTPLQTGLDASLSILQVADFDLDGHLDVATGTRESAVDAVFIRGTGTGSFSVDPLAEGERAPVNVTKADADGDGDLDLFYRSDDPLRIGVFVNESIPAPGLSVCAPALANSSGLSATAHALGSADASAAALTLRATKLPKNQFGLFAGSRTFQAPAAVPGSAGQLCLAGSIGRYIGPGQIVSSGPFGSFDVVIQPTALVDGQGATAAIPGETWYFQAWFRDFVPQVGATSNFTDAIALTFE